MEDVIQKFAEGGPLSGWILSAIFLTAIVYLFNKLISAKEQHLDDMKNANDVAETLKEAFVPLVSGLESVKTTLEILKDRDRSK